MNRYGRTSLLVILGLTALIVCVIVIFLSGRESLTSVGGRFMTALAAGDAPTLTSMTYMGTESPEAVRKQWDEAVGMAGRYYNFTWRILGADQADPRTGSVRLGVTRDVAAPGSYEQNYQLPLIKVGDEWKVDVRGISREMYPDLPQ
jgi:hypothetical protein